MQMHFLTDFIKSLVSYAIQKNAVAHSNCASDCVKNKE